MKKFVVLMLLVTGCASNPNKMKNLDVGIESKGKVSDSETVGLNSAGEAIVQQRKKAADELRGVVWWNNKLEQDLSSERSDLRRCRVESADPRLNGSGEVKSIPEVDKLKPVAKVREQLGLVDNDLVVVKEEYLIDRLKLERDYNDTLENMVSMVKNYKEQCEDHLGMQRVKAGLPSKRYQGKFNISPDGKLLNVVEKHETSLDDAFEIRSAKEQAKEQPIVREPAVYRQDQPAQSDTVWSQEAGQ